MECSARFGSLRTPQLVMGSRVSSVRLGARVKSINSTRASLYDVLSVQQNGSAHDIKTAYRRMALKCHPDVCPPSQREECTTKFLQLQEAYKTLSDPLLRQDYDWTLENRLESIESEGRFDGSNSVWEAQLMELIRRRSGYDNNSWGSTMRTRKQQQAAAAASSTR